MLWLLMGLVASPLTAGSGGDTDTGSADQEESLIATGQQLVHDLGCVICHDMEGQETTVRDEAPDLSYEGEIVQTEWLRAFLENPTSIRPFIKARMPHFRLTDGELESITYYLESLTAEGEPLAETFRYPMPGESLAEIGAQLVSPDYFDCFSCHMRGDQTPGGEPEEWAPDLEQVKNRINPDFYFKWLADPPTYRPDTEMPAFFTDEYSGPDDILDGDEQMQIVAIRDFLMSIGKEQSFTLEAAHLPKASLSHLSWSRGRRLVTKLNCVGCHEFASLPMGKKVGPNLSAQGSRVRRGWLTDFLRSPYTITPEYELMGSHARMPTFSFTEEELLAIVTFIMEVLVDPTLPDKVELDPGLSAKGKALFRTKLCNNCHRIRKSPGSIGPDLTDAGERLRAEWVVTFIQRPAHYLDTRMPNLKVTEDEALALASYILHPKD